MHLSSFCVESERIVTGSPCVPKQKCLFVLCGPGILIINAKASQLSGLSDLGASSLGSSLKSWDTRYTV